MMGIQSVIIETIKWSLCVVYCLGAFLAVVYQWLVHSLKFWRVVPRPTPPASLTNPGFDLTHTHVPVNGVKLHCVSSGDDKKKLMLFVHGFPEFWYSWRQQMKHFSKDYWVVAVDMRGYGDSEKPAKVSDYSMDKLRTDIQQLPAALGRKKIDVLVAHDWGGAVCWNLIDKHSHLVDLYVSINVPHPGGYEKAMKSGLKQFKKSWYIFMFQMPYVPEIILRSRDLYPLDAMIRGKNKEWSNVTDEDMEAFKYTYSKPGAFTPPLNYYRAVDFATSKDFKKVKVPTLMIWGNDDFALSEETAHYSAEFVEDYTLKIVEGAPHFITNTHPKLVNYYMEEWLSHKT